MEDSHEGSNTTLLAHCSGQSWMELPASEPQADYRGSLRFPRGKTLGGSSSINLIVYIRGDRSDFDGWSQSGCEGWDYDERLPYFIKAEHNSRPGAPLTDSTVRCTPKIDCSPTSCPTPGLMQPSSGACHAMLTSTVNPSSELAPTK